MRDIDRGVLLHNAGVGGREHGEIHFNDFVCVARSAIDLIRHRSAVALLSVVVHRSESSQVRRGLRVLMLDVLAR